MGRSARRSPCMPRLWPSTTWSGSSASATAWPHSAPTTAWPGSPRASARPCTCMPPCAGWCSATFTPQDRRRMSRPGELGAMGPYTAAVTAGVDGPFELGTDGPTAILVGIDGSTTSLRAASYAAGLARRQHARVTAVYVAPVASLGTAGPGGADLAAARHEAFSQAVDDMRRRAEEVSRELGISVTFIAAEGDPFTELRRIADETRADAVVVGASAHAGHRLVGSLAVRLVRAGRWPVTVVP